MKDKIKFSSAKNISLVELPAGDTRINPANPGQKSAVITKKGTEFRLKGKDTLWFCALVKMDGSSGWVEFDVNSQHGGKVKKRITIKK